MMLKPLLAQVAPGRVHRDNQSDLLDPQPAFDFLLPLNRVADIFKAFEVNQAVEFLSSCEK
jgi:hypothetical protein